MADARPDPEALLVHGPWLRGLARSLVGDDAAADDLVQETWAAALTRPPRDPAAGRAWLSRVVRNFARKRHRSELRRKRRETEVAERTGSRPDADGDPVEQMELHRRVVDAVLALPEPYREVIIRRYFHDATPSQIAERLGIPVKTVKTRLHRGLQRLRADLDDRYGDRAAWSAVAIPLAQSVSLGTTAATVAVTGSVSLLELLGGAAVIGKVGVVGLIVVLMAGLVWWWSDSNDLSNPVVPTVVTRSDARSTVGAPLDSESETTTSLIPKSQSVETAPGPTIRGRVVDRDTGQPVAGARVDWVEDHRFEANPWRLRSGGKSIEAAKPNQAVVDEQIVQLPFDPRLDRLAGQDATVVLTDDAGVFELGARPGSDAYFRVTHEEYRYEWRPELATGSEPVQIELSPKRWLTIDVRDSDGRVPDVPPALAHGYVYGQLDAAPEWEVMRAFHWDESGTARFELADVHRVHVSLAAPKFEWVSAAVEPPYTAADLALTLEPHPWIGARLVDPVGDPIPGVEAVVFSEPASDPNRSGTVVFCGDDGRFAANVRPAGPLFVAFSAPGFEGREVRDLERGRDDQTVVLEPVRMSRLHGRVVTAEGRSAPGLIVEMGNATSSGPPPTSTTDEAGRFAFEAIPPGRYDAVLWVLNEDGSRSRVVGLEAQPIAIEPASNHTAELVLAGETGTILGSVETPEAGPVTNTLIFLQRVRRLQPPENVSLTALDDHGRFGFEHVPAGRYLVKVGLGGSFSQMVTVESGQVSELPIGRDSVRVQMHLRDADEPCAGASIIAGRFDLSGVVPVLTDIRTMRTGDSGSTTRGLFAAGRYLARVEYQGRVFVNAFEVAVGADATSEVWFEWPPGILRIEAEEAGAITVDLVETAGITLEDAVPLAQRRMAFGPTAAGADGVNAFEVDGVNPGRYRLTFIGSDGIEHSRTVRVEPAGLRLRVDEGWKTP